MSLKKIGFVGLIAMLVVCFGAINASADWYDCEIVMVGNGVNDLFVRLTDTANPPAFTQTTFFINGPKNKEMLATILTAISMGKLIKVNAVDTAPWSDVIGVYLIP